MIKLNISKLCLQLSIVCLSFSLAVIAQKDDSGSRANKLINSNSMKLGLSVADQKNLIILNAYEDKSNGLYMVYAQQTYKGIGVYNAIQVMAFKDDKLVSVAGNRISKMELKTKSISSSPGLSSTNAVIAAAKHLQLPLPSIGRSIKEERELFKTTFGQLGISSQNITAQLMWIPGLKENIKLGWQVQIAPLSVTDYWLIRVDAANGDFIAKDNLTVFCNWLPNNNNNKDAVYEVKHYDNTSDKIISTEKITNKYDVNSSTYRVIPYPVESPIHPGGAPTLKLDPWTLAPAGSNATTLKWNNDGITDYDITRGNNVYSQEDRDHDNSTYGISTVSSTTLPDLTFDPVPDFTKSPLVKDNQRFALTNLFYWNNIVHDISYLYGFDEIAGNFQASNLSRGGNENDFVIADAQDAGGSNNANFSTPPDGSNPRMQMYLWNGRTDRVLLVNAPANLAGYINAAESGFSINNKLQNVGPVTGNIIYYNDDLAGNTHQACGAAANDLTGKIALIDRGENCTFVSKAKNAQNAGAVAVIIVNNVPGDSVIIMGGSDNTITIPTLMISFNSGTTIKTELNNGVTVNVTLKAPPKLDGALDNGIIVHEYTHGISNRLTGGPATTTCLFNSEQMGEGWSDYMALMATTDWATAQVSDGPKRRPVGTYTLGQDALTGAGSRNYPYSTDMSVNPWTYSMLATNTDGEAHNVGEIWCTALWDMTWELIQIDGINNNLYAPDSTGGNSTALKLVMEGMKLQPCSPGFIDGRNAILKADSLLFNGKYSCAIWHAFARRGMGVNASQGSSFSYTDQVEDFSTLKNAYVVETADVDSAYRGQLIRYNLAVNCRCTPVSNYKLVDTLPVYVTFKKGGIYDSTNRTITFNNINLVPGQQKNYKFGVIVNKLAPQFNREHINEHINSSTIPLRWTATSATGTPFVVSGAKNNSAPYAFYAQDYGATSEATIVTTGTFNVQGRVTLSFWHYFDTEPGWDGGVVEALIDSVWTDLGPYMTSNGYNGVLAVSSLPLGGRSAFTGSSNNMFIRSTIDLSTFAGKTIQVRFRFVSDLTTGGDGWYIDDILLNSRAEIVNHVQLFDATDIEQNSSTVFTLVIKKPITLTQHFIAVKQDKIALLNWINTTSENRGANYIIERSTDGNPFVEIASVSNQGAPGADQDYSTVDQNPVPGINYYRIKTVAVTGEISYSDVRSLIFEPQKGRVFITPNPARDHINVTVAGNTKTLSILLVNNIGQHVKSFTMKGQNLQLNVSNLPAGVYNLRIQGDGITSSYKVVVAK